jgi:hypothetical protein
MVKFLLPCCEIPHPVDKGYRRGNHAQLVEVSLMAGQASILKILVESSTVKFDENSRLIRIDIAQKRHLNANDRFNPICYGLVQRRRNSRRG